VIPATTVHTHSRRSSSGTNVDVLLRVRLVGFQHALKDIERGMLERSQTLGRFHQHVLRRAAVITADAATWNRGVFTSLTRLTRVGRATSGISRMLAALERRHR
jgi:hypothetical protein